METTNNFTIVIHGGAGTLRKEQFTEEQEKAYKKVLSDALTTGHTILKNGGTSSDAVEAAIVVMEDNPLFNAGKGAVYTNTEMHELDASFMEGKTMNAGAIAGAKLVKNPIKAARVVLEQSSHVMLSGNGADMFASEQGLDMVSNNYFHTERRLKSLQNVKVKEQETQIESSQLSESGDHKFGTVGAVALDKYGNIAAGTSTGGMTNKRYGRIGDSPIIGAGTYANNATCGVSCTGHGEFFIRYAVAFDISALMEYKEWSLEKAANHVVLNTLKERGGSGGVVALDKLGNVVMPFNTSGMYRGYVKADGVVNVFIF